jgi:S-adenosylmethionine-diacylglycerol 3-amino-3-carboxypropyl transferase
MAKNKMIKSEVEDYAEFNLIRYAQVWEDAEILIKALEIKETDDVLSIGSAGENAFSLLLSNPNKVYAIDLNEEQIFCIQLKIAAYKYLDYEECMQFIGVFDCENRNDIFDEKIKEKIPKKAREYFESHRDYIKRGIIHCGKFENYFHIFGNKVLPLIHSRKTRDRLLQKKTKEERYEFYDKVWNNRRWRVLFKMFFSRKVMGKLGRDKAFFRYVNVNVAEHILERTKYAITELDTSENSYLQYIINCRYDNALPVAYRKENFETIKSRLDKLVVLKETVETFINRDDIKKIDKCNLSDIFEYMSEDDMCNIVKVILTKAPKGSRIAYWNMLSDKQASRFIDEIEYKEELSKQLLAEDKAFFYSKFIVEEVK